MDKIGELGIDISLIVAQAVNFLILLALLYFFGLNRILKMLDERSQKIRDSVEQADQVKAEAARAEEENRKKLEAAGKEGQEAISVAGAPSDEVVKDMMFNARSLIELLRGHIDKEDNVLLPMMESHLTDHEWDMVWEGVEDIDLHTIERRE